MSGNIIQPGWTAFYAKQHEARKALDTFDADMAELDQLEAQIHDAIKDRCDEARWGGHAQINMLLPPLDVANIGRCIWAWDNTWPEDEAATQLADWRAELDAATS